MRQIQALPNNFNALAILTRSATFPFHAEPRHIHWPTDSSLLWDTWRVASRLLRRGREIMAGSRPHRFHDKKTRRLYLLITRYAKSTNERRQKPVEFGHMVLLCQSPEKFITDYETFARRRADCDLTEEVIDRHEKLFEQPPPRREN